ncbi:hypothetical protein HDU90_008952 [Geranomyces variabilis]|nr:hypothetical protein HDU90_008952 [Geranomyces variabilis]
MAKALLEQGAGLITDPDWAGPNLNAKRIKWRTVQQKKQKLILCMLYDLIVEGKVQAYPSKNDDGEDFWFIPARDLQDRDEILSTTLHAIAYDTNNQDVIPTRTRIEGSQLRGYFIRATILDALAEEEADDSDEEEMNGQTGDHQASPAPHNPQLLCVKTADQAMEGLETMRNFLTAWGRSALSGLQHRGEWGGQDAAEAMEHYQTMVDQGLEPLRCIICGTGVFICCPICLMPLCKAHQHIEYNENRRCRHG